MSVISRSIDIIEVNCIQEQIDYFGEQFERQYFTSIERSVSWFGLRRTQYLAGRWVAKRAILTIFGQENEQNLPWLEIEIPRLPTGAPSVILHQKSLTLATELGIKKWLLSISHTSLYAAASVIALS
ncbi:MAG: holo-ACP synthase [Coleofasciculaceae cyanobacterium]